MSELSPAPAPFTNETRDGAPCPLAGSVVTLIAVAEDCSADVADATGVSATLPRVREVDVLDLAVLEAMVLQALGPDHDGLRVHRPGEGTLVVTVSATARAAADAVCASQDPLVVEGWMELLVNGLAEEALTETGPDWLAEAELGVELTVAARSAQLPLVLTAAAHAPLVVDARRSIPQLLAGSIVDPAMVFFV